MYRHVSEHVHKQVRIDMCIGICMDMCRNLCIDMCADRCLGIYVLLLKCVYRHVCCDVEGRYRQTISRHDPEGWSLNRHMDGWTLLADMCQQTCVHQHVQICVSICGQACEQI